MLWPTAGLVVRAYTLDTAILAIAAPALVLATLAVTALGFWAIGRELRDRPGDDPHELSLRSWILEM